jgi:hypothetical protein
LNKSFSGSVSNSDDDKTQDPGGISDDNSGMDLNDIAENDEPVADIEGDLVILQFACLPLVSASLSLPAGTKGQNERNRVI